MKNLKFVTKILHNKFLKEDPHGALHMPIYDNVAFEFKSAEDIELAFQGKKPAHMYSRISNPTIENFEQKIRIVTDSLGVVAVSSGMAAISNVILAIANSGDNIVTTKYLFGNTYSLFEKTLKSWGLKAKYTDLTKGSFVEGLIDKKTKAIFFETITNPQLEVADVEVLAKIAKSRGILLIADTTVTPPYIFNSKALGVDIEVLSSTKYISGGATSVGGIIIDNGGYDWSKNEKLRGDVKQYGPFTFLKKLRREVYRNLGACLSPYNAFLQSIGLETLPLRVDVSCANALAIAKFLQKSPQVKDVNYPGLKSSKYFALSQKQFEGKPGSLLTFDLASKDECFKFMNKLQIIRRSTNLNDNRTLIIHPASTIFCEYDEKLKQDMGVRETMIRLAVGIEDSEDLISDIGSALKR
ncbi:MAG: PLP-dependent transferase [Omnitrophica bacterium]|nr:PLP-dependent transferase [Candidatus Omnitrophota bacterium]